MNHDPIVRFKELSTQAEQLGIVPYNAAAFSSADERIIADRRMLLLKDVDDRGRVFYPNLESRKARHQREVYTRQLVVG